MSRKGNEGLARSCLLERKWISWTGKGGHGDGRVPKSQSHLVRGTLMDTTSLSNRLT